jgi:hypothetical protein
VQILAYANDDVIEGRYQSAVKIAFNVLKMATQKMGLINYTKQNIW